MATRPMAELFCALEELGVTVNSPNGKLPATITGPVIFKSCELDAGRSSQFLSALLMIAPLVEKGMEINLVGKQVSSSYVDMTIYWMQRMGVTVDRQSNKIDIEGKQNYQGIDVTIPGDAVSASYFMGLVGITGGEI
jgi:3-phosphoshikimate 1-carboxyvinyltransferase